MHPQQARPQPPLYTAEERRRRDASPWTMLQGVLAPAAAGHDRRVSLQGLPGSGHPGGQELAVAVDKLHKSSLWMLCQKQMKPGIARSRSGERSGHVKRQYIRTHGVCQLDGPISLSHVAWPS